MATTPPDSIEDDDFSDSFSSSSLSLDNSTLSSLDESIEELSPKQSYLERRERLRLYFVQAAREIANHFREIKSEAVELELTLMPKYLKLLPEYQAFKETEEEEEGSVAIDGLFQAMEYNRIELLEKLVKRFGDKTIKLVFRKYKKKLIYFNKTTTLREAAEEWPEDTDTHEMTDLTMKMGDKWEERTLHNLQKITEELRQKMPKYRKYNFHLKRIARGCVVVTFQVYSEVPDESLERIIDIEVLRANHILKASQGHTIIYDVESPKNYEIVDRQDVSVYYFCPIRRGELMVEPVKTLCCNRHMSRRTAEQAKKNGPCPLCMEELQFKLDPHLREKISLIKIYCPYKCEGCHWMEDVRFVNTHLHHSDKYSCRYALIECPAKCGASVQRLSRDEHLEKCPQHNRHLVCLHCGAEYIAKENHKGVCPKHLVSCPYKCMEEMERENVAKHLRVCPKLQVKFKTPEETSSVETQEKVVGEKYVFLAVTKELSERTSELNDIRIEILKMKLKLLQLQNKIQHGATGREEEQREEGEEEEEKEEEEEEGEEERKGGAEEDIDKETETLLHKEAQLEQRREELEREIRHLKEKQQREYMKGHKGNSW